MAGGAGVLYATMSAMGLTPAAADTPDFVAPGSGDLHGRRHSVVVLGGGMAGLTAAYELRKAGYQVAILEARNRPGGRNWTVRGGTEETDLKGNTQTATFSNDQYVNPGPARIAQHHVTLDYCRELGVPIEPFVNQNAAAYQYLEGNTVLSNTPIRHRAGGSTVPWFRSVQLSSPCTVASWVDDLPMSEERRYGVVILV
jgi:monoamine oxidase